ncbi:hypothetical protein Taro_001830 [Colocasia esculenta]|uniref:Uncharacterized protein n=1 Tax=Colocasia esculenta TaxID=4460 RepID=A0A843TCC8_COLES|nr:hypothetical protein [Colocasia esculenta]
MLPSPVWYVCGLWAAPGWSILWVCLSAGVATTVHVMTPEEPSAWVAGSVPFPVAMDLLVGNAVGYLAAFSDRSGAWRGAIAWPSCDVACILVVFCGGSISLFRGGGGRSQAAYTVVVAWPCLASVGVVGLALVARASGGFRSVFSRFRSPVLCLGGCAKGYFCLVPNSVGFCEFLLLWSVRDCSESKCCELLYLSEMRVVLCKFSGFVGCDVNFREGCSYCYVPCVASVVVRCVRAVVARLAVELLAVVFLVWRTVVGKSRRGALGRLHCVCGLLFVHCCALCSARSALLLGLSRCSVCRVASLVEHCDTCLWLFVDLVLASCEL